MVSPNVIMFIRHGEKPGDDGPPHGIDHQGERDDHALSVRGWTRAGALAGLFAYAPSASHPHIVVPERIFATQFTKDYRSKREVDTATPLAHRLGLNVDTDYDHAHAKDLSATILADSTPALVVWHHGSMAELLGCFPIANRDDVPAKWPEDRFDLIWVLVRKPDAPEYQFLAVPQGLLHGDAPA